MMQVEQTPETRKRIRIKPSTTRSIADALTLKNKNIFFLSRLDGSIPLDDDHGFGLYYHDCRFLSGYQPSIEKSYLISSSLDQITRSSAVIQLFNAEIQLVDGTELEAREITTAWERLLDGDKNEVLDTVQIKNESDHAIEFPLWLALRAGFEDVFLIRGLTFEQPGTMISPQLDEAQMLFSYHGADQLYRSLSVRFSVPPSRMDQTGVEFGIKLGPGESWEVSISLQIEEGYEPCSFTDEKADLPEPSSTCISAAGKLSEQMDSQTLFQSDNRQLNRVLRNSLDDLSALITSIDGHEFFAAGVPWFTTLFGRDSLITALQTLPIQPAIAAETLRLLAHFQAQEVDAWRDAQPGKILHELRTGELARLGHIPHTPYYGTVDATPLFLVLLVRYTEWTGDINLFQELELHVLRALEWIDSYGDANRDGYVEYLGTSPHGLTNQGWKDSDHAIVTPLGDPVDPPISLVEVQGYVYQAKVGLAGLFEHTGNWQKAAALRREARQLRTRFNRDFWMEDQGIYALALDADGEPVRVVSSNPGHALWSGIADPEKARQTANRLMGNDMFSGWGIRTLSEKEKAYDANSYHRGSIWPHDNAIIASGLWKYGFGVFARQIFTGILEAAVTFDGYRLPELFAGFPRRGDTAPVRYPVSCHPQAWAAGSIPQMVSVLLGLEPAGLEDQLQIKHPMLPNIVNQLRVQNLRVGQATVDLHYERRRNGHVKVDVEKVDGDLDISHE